MHSPSFKDAIETRRERERYLSVNTNLSLRVTKVASVNQAITMATYQSNPSEVARVLMDLGAKSLGIDLEKIV